ncbi:alpha/beta fold hydrolase [Arthrobacter sp. PAMC25284]|uniref:alpha/beta fold hydrolase n=1 Tax=Arthrobacter sp. PAMC25284 TaxID=2861279 RepID=UPI001C635EEE|nr:alpha/beta hydrolase [Arthrobacter sp. PAMC25284]QYF90389.1 alpha/beta fold hydrolase [Arthrobacter sp. PAMC25284]
MIQSVQSADGTTIAYEQAGTGPVLILVGGALNNRQSAANLVPLLEESFTVVSYDRRGRGDSTNTPPYDVDREVEDLRALAAEAEGPVYLYGHSSGGILALEAGSAGVPVGKIAVYEPPYLTGGGEDWQAFVDKVRTLADSGQGNKAVEVFIRHTGADFDPGMTQAPWWPALVSLAPTLAYDLTLTANGSVPADRFAGITAPVLALYGGASAGWAAASATAVASAVPDGRRDMIDGQDHAVAPDAVAPVLLKFFR